MLGSSRRIDGKTGYPIEVDLSCFNVDISPLSRIVVIDRANDYILRSGVKVKENGKGKKNWLGGFCWNIAQT